MSTLKTNAAQIGQSVTATNNFTLYQPTTPDGTVRLGVGNAGSVTDVMQFQQYGVGIPRGTTEQRPATPTSGMVRFNTTTSVMEIYNGASWVGIGLLDGSSEFAAASTAQDLYNLGMRTNGYYWLKLSGSTPKPIYCILDDSIEAGYGYMRVYDQRTATSGEIKIFYSGDTDYSNWVTIGGNSYVITHFAVSTYNAQTSVVKYTNAGGGLHSSISPKTIGAALAQGWTASGFETDNWRYFGAGTSAGTSPSTAQIYLGDDNDAGGASSTRQTAKTGTPQGILFFPSTASASAFDAGNQYWGNGGMEATAVALYVR